MKKLLIPLIIVICFVGAAVLTYSALQLHNAYVAKQTALKAAEQAQAASVATKEDTLRQAELSTVIAQYNGQVGECQKGAVAYSKLPLVTQKLTAAPHCGALIK